MMVKIKKRNMEKKAVLSPEIYIEITNSDIKIAREKILLLNFLYKQNIHKIAYGKNLLI